MFEKYVPIHSWALTKLSEHVKSGVKLSFAPLAWSRQLQGKTRSPEKKSIVENDGA